MGIGFKEMAIVLVVALIIFGGKRLPELGRGLGLGLSNFRKAISGKDDRDALEGRSGEGEKPLTGQALPKAPPEA